MKKCYHTKVPSDKREYLEWAAKKSVRHYAGNCMTCNTAGVIWRRKGNPDAEYDPNDYQTFTTKDMPEKKRRKLDVGDIWSNAAQCLLCNDVIRSKNRHDFVQCSCRSLAVDGGSWYSKRMFGNWHNKREMIVFYDDSKGAVQRMPEVTPTYNPWKWIQDLFLR